MVDSQLLSQVTAIIKTFERPDALDRLILSIRRYYPHLKILVGDDSYTPYPRYDVEYVRMPADVGVSAGRNALLSRVATPYFLQLDDDFEFTRHTKIEQLLRVVKENAVVLAAGDCMVCKRGWIGVRRKRIPYHGLVIRDGDHLQLTRGHHARSGRFLICDIVNQFFVARTDCIRALGGWDPQLKTNEHEEFFLRLVESGQRAAYVPDVVIDHWCDRPPRYARYRNRDYLPLMARKHGLRRLTTFKGHTYSF